MRFGVIYNRPSASLIWIFLAIHLPPDLGAVRGVRGEGRGGGGGGGGGGGLRVRPH